MSKNIDHPQQRTVSAAGAPPAAPADAVSSPFAMGQKYLQQQGAAISEEDQRTPAPVPARMPQGFRAGLFSDGSLEIHSGEDSLDLPRPACARAGRVPGHDRERDRAGLIMAGSSYIDVVVRDAHNTYSTSAKGQRASCTGGARPAAERLAAKLFPGTYPQVTELPAALGDGAGVTRWRLHSAVQKSRPRSAGK